MNSYWNLCKATLSLSLVLWVVGFSQEEVSVSDFRYPETRALDWKGGLNGSLSSSKYSSVYPDRMSDSRGRNNDFSIYTSVLFFHSKENHDNLITFNGRLGYSSSKTESDRSPVYDSYEDHSSGKSASLWATWTYAHYFSDADKFHFVGTTNASYSGSIREDSHVSKSSPPYSREGTTKSYDFTASGFAGIGYGRMRDGTFVIRAMRILERLQEDEVIPHLSREQMLMLIDKVAHTREYVTNHERYEKFLVQDIIKELASGGIIPQEAITPFSVLKIAEAMREQIEPRFFGWRTYYAIGGNARHHLYDYVSGSTTDHTFYRDGMIRHRVAAEFGHPFSAWTHVNAQASVEIPQKIASKFYAFDFEARAIHQLGEKIDLVCGYRFHRWAGNDENWADDTYYQRSIRHSADATFRFFLEDRVSFNCSIYYNSDSYNAYDSHRIPVDDNASSTSSGFGVYFGINYNII